MMKSKRRLSVLHSSTEEEGSKSKRVRGEFCRERGQLRSCTSSYSSSSSYLYLPDDLVEQILQRLPVKSILRFRCVSKSWCALFKTDTFIKNHKGRTMLLLNRPIPPFPAPNHFHAGFCFHNLDSPDQEELDRYIPTKSYENLLVRSKSYNNGTLRLKGIHGSLNGIICLCYHPLHSLRKRYYILCNPALRQFKLLPPCLSFKPRHRYHRLLETVDGFGISNITNQFKVITMQVFMIDYREAAHYVIAHVYDSGSDSWREVKNVPLVPVQPMNSSGDVIFFNGACHWPAETFSAKLEGIRKGILSFDMTSELFRHLEVPDCLQGDMFHVAIPLPVVVVDNCLALVHVRKFENASDPVDIWVMKEYGVKESWTKLFVIRPQPYASVFLPSKGDDMFMVQEPHRTKQMAKGILQGTIGRNDARLNAQLTSINVRTNEMKTFQIFGSMATTRALIYEESLVPLY